MKKIITLACALSCIIGASAQSIYDAAKLAEKDLNGTARFVGMGGAMGALGGDITTMGTNPAGIGIYRSNDVMTSFSFSAYGAESKYDRETFNNDKNRWSFDNIGFVFSTKVGNETPLRYVNFGFNYKRSKSLYKNMSMAGFMGVYGDRPVSQANYMAQQATDSSNYFWGETANFSFIRTITHLAHLAFDMHFCHETLYGLVVDDITTVPHLPSDTSIAITSFVLMENGFDFFFLHCVFIWFLKPFQMIIEYGTSHLS